VIVGTRIGRVKRFRRWLSDRLRRRPSGFPSTVRRGTKNIRTDTCRDCPSRVSFCMRRFRPAGRLRGKGKGGWVREGGKKLLGPDLVFPPSRLALSNDRPLQSAMTYSNPQAAYSTSRRVLATFSETLSPEKGGYPVPDQGNLTSLAIRYGSAKLSVEVRPSAPAGGRRFLTVKKIPGCSSAWFRALGSGPRGRRFKSFHPDCKSSRTLKSRPGRPAPSPAPPLATASG